MKFNVIKGRPSSSFKLEILFQPFKSKTRKITEKYGYLTNREKVN